MENFEIAMQRRVKEREPLPVAEKRFSPDGAESLEQSERLYEHVFGAHGGKTIQNRYASGNPPRLHQQFFEAIVEAMEGESEAVVILGPILEKMNISRNQTGLMLSCFEHYGYFSFRRSPGKGRRIVFRLLKRMQRDSR